MMTRIAILLPLLGLYMAGPVGARDLIVSRSVVEDPQARLTIDEVARMAGRPMGSSLELGRYGVVHWVRIQVEAPADGDQVVLFILPTYLNEVRLYEPDDGKPGQWRTRVTGNHYPYHLRDRDAIPLSFLLTQTEPLAVYYLRIRTRSPLSLTVEALEPEDAYRRDNQHALVEMFFVTSMLFLLIGAIYSYYLIRQRVAGLFAIHQAVYILFGVVATGYLAPIAPPAFPQLMDWMNAVLYLTIAFTSLLFCREVLRPYDPPPLLLRGLNLMVYVFPILLATLAMGKSELAILTNSILIKITFLYFVIVAFTVRREGTPSRRTLRIFFTFILLHNALFWAFGRSLWFAPSTNMEAFRMLVIDGLVIGGLFAVMLHARTRQILREAHRTATDLLLVQQRFEMERQLKRQMEVQAHTDYLTGLNNRRRFLELAESEFGRAARFQRPFALLGIDIDHFKAINDTHGHSAGDMVLQRLAALMREALRKQDILGRMGGEEFSAVLVEADRAEAFVIAQRLRKAVEDATITAHNGERIRVTISVGCAQRESRHTDLNTLMNEADGALYHAKQTGRNRVCAVRPAAEHHSAEVTTSQAG